MFPIKPPATAPLSPLFILALSQPDSCEWGSSSWWPLRSQWNMWPTFVCSAAFGSASVFLCQTFPVFCSVPPFCFLKHSPFCRHLSAFPSSYCTRMQHFRAHHWLLTVHLTSPCPRNLYSRACMCTRCTFLRAHTRIYTQRSPSLASLGTALLWLTDVPINHWSPGGARRSKTNWTNKGEPQ